MTYDWEHDRQMTALSLFFERAAEYYEKRALQARKRSLQQRLLRAVSRATEDFRSQGGDMENAHVAFFAADSQIRGNGSGFHLCGNAPKRRWAVVQRTLRDYVANGGNPKARIRVLIGVARLGDEERLGTSGFVYVYPQDISELRLLHDPELNSILRR